MTRNGCRAHVEKEFNAVKVVENTSINLEKEEATIDMEHHISSDTLQEALKDTGYEILKHGGKSEKKKPDKSKISVNGTGSVSVIANAITLKNIKIN